MGYSGDSLASMFEAAKQPTEQAAKDITSDFGSKITDLAQRNAPVLSGDLKKSLKKIRVHVKRVEGGVVTYSSGVHTFLDYAPSVEHGSGLWGPQHRKYLIKPRKPGGTLSWIDKTTGERRFAKYVWHPGQPPQKYVARAVAEAEATAEQIARPGLKRWEARVEAAWRAL